MNVLVSRKAPDFTAPAVMGNGEIINQFCLSEHIKDKYALIFFYPLDFTFVCPTEIIAFDHRNSELVKRGVELIGISIDSHFVHNAWRNTPIEKGGIGPVSFPLVADIDHGICQAYGIEHPDAGVAFRAAFIVDRNGIVRSQMINDLPIGRNVDELIRLIDALQFVETHGEVCPAGWNKGDKGMSPSVPGVADYLKDHASEL